MSALVHWLAAPRTPSPSPTMTMTMTTNPAPGIGDTVNLAAPWQWTLPLVLTVALGVVTAVGVVVTLWQKHRSDSRVQLWNRMQWALSAASTKEEPMQSVGAMAVSQLAGMYGKKPRRQRFIEWWGRIFRPKTYPKVARPPARLTTYDVELLDNAIEVIDRRLGK